jgi:site-specific DNA-methyltransferase (adenine-specific)
MTSTRSFGSSDRENHDASGFYDRFDKPVESKTKLSELPPPLRLNAMLFCADARSMPSVPDGTVALVVTSPPY